MTGPKLNEATRKAGVSSGTRAKAMNVRMSASKVRMVLKNDLPESTSLHLHGIRVPNGMDGVDPYTQKPITPGSEFTYEFTALEPSVGMYHSHHDAQVQVPNGLAGALIIGDWKSLAMGVARSRVKDTDGIAEQENMMVLNDSGTIGLSLNGKSFPATSPYALKVGESMVVHYFNEGNMTHPMPQGMEMPGEVTHRSEDAQHLLCMMADIVGFTANFHQHVQHAVIDFVEPTVQGIELIAQDEAKRGGGRAQRSTRPD